MQILFPIIILAVVGNSILADDCSGVDADFQKCSEKAYSEYKAALRAGEDGRPHWRARKSCNYMTAAVEDCGNNLIGVCKSEEEVVKDKDRQYKRVLVHIIADIPEWDSEKCPAVKAHLERARGSDPSGDQDSQNTENSQTQTNGSSASMEHFTFLPLLVLIIFSS